MASVWSTKKDLAIAEGEAILSQGEQPVETAVQALALNTGISAKNALKALYALTVSGSASLTGNWATGTIKMGGA